MRVEQLPQLSATEQNPLHPPLPMAFQMRICDLRSVCPQGARGRRWLEFHFGPVASRDRPFIFSPLTALNEVIWWPDRRHRLAGRERNPSSWRQVPCSLTTSPTSAPSAGLRLLPRVVRSPRRRSDSWRGRGTTRGWRERGSSCCLLGAVRGIEWRRQQRLVGDDESVCAGVG